MRSQEECGNVPGVVENAVGEQGAIPANGEMSRRNDADTITTIR